MSMRATSFRGVMQGICRHDGLDYTQIANVQDDFGEYINERLREAWTWEWRPEMMLLEQRQYRPDFDDDGTYAIDDIVWDPTGKKYYISLANSNTDALSDATKWSDDLGEWDRYIAYEQTGKTKLGDVKGIYERNPRKNTTPGRLNFEMSENGIQVSSLAGNQVFVEFRKRPPEFTGTLYENTTANYYVGDLVWDEGTALGAQNSGECAVCIQAHTNSPARTPDNASYWTKVDFPWILRPFVVRAAYSDFLAADGQTGKSIAEERRAFEHLEHAADAIGLPQQGEVASVGTVFS